MERVWRSRRVAVIVFLVILLFHLQLCSCHYAARGKLNRGKAARSAARVIRSKSIQIPNKYRGSSKPSWPTPGDRLTPTLKKRWQNKYTFQANSFVPPKPHHTRSLPLPPSVSPWPRSPKFSPRSTSFPPPKPAHSATLPSPSPVQAHASSPPVSGAASEAKNAPTSITDRIFVLLVTGASFILAISAALFMLCYRSSKVVTVRPWATGLSGQLQKAFVTGVPSLKRSELEIACEDFSNVIGSLPDYILYKGTLSSGVEIAVVSTTNQSAKDWSEHCESQFRKKITSLSRVNHKNFVNLLGYCEQDEPFTRMMVFEYAPNGTLLEHLHVKEEDHLDWPTRLRVAVGIAYCLEHMHQLSPPEILKTLDTSTVLLTDDFAAKVSDIFFCEEAKKESTDITPPVLSDKESVVYSYGMLLLEIMTGRFAVSEGGLLESWAACFLRRERQLIDMMDPNLNSFHDADTVAKLSKLILSCADREPSKRPAMSEVAAKLREITAMTPDAATPRVSPLWWAELEIISTEAN